MCACRRKTEARQQERARPERHLQSFAALGSFLCFCPKDVRLARRRMAGSQAAIESTAWEGPCNERLVSQLLTDLRGWGVDLESLKPSDLYDTIKGRTLW